jgi:dienelactone hydrolase
MRRQPPRGSQNWIFDNFLKISDNEDVLHPGMMGVRLERGFKYSDMHRVFDRVSGRRSFPREWARAAKAQEAAAEAALALGRRVTASQHFHRAALYHGRAQHLIPVDGHPKKIESHAAVIRCYDKMIELLDGAVTRHVIPFENGKNVFCLFHRAPGDGPKPTILYNPGMDAMKEDFPNPFNNEFVRRGMNVCVMDGPGQGEANINQTWLALGNYARAGSKVLDFLVAHDDVDAEKIGEFGTSMGTRYGVEIAAADPRIKAVVGQMSCVGPMDVIFNQAQPNFKRIHMYMTNTYDEAAFDDLADAMDENFVKAGQAMRCPYLLVAGDMDELCPAEDVQEWVDKLNCPKELWLYEDVFHPMGEVVAEIYPAIADWLLAALTEGVAKGHDRRLVLQAGQSPLAFSQPNRSQQEQTQLKVAQA